MYFDDSWFWPILDGYRDPCGNTLEEAESTWLRASDVPVAVATQVIADRQWRLSPKSETAIRNLIDLLEAFYHPEDAFTYLEFGTCFGTTIASVLRRFQNARGIGLEVNPSRFGVSQWLTNRVHEKFGLGARLTLRPSDILHADLEPDSVDAVFMDTNHRYPDDYEYITHVLTSGILRRGFVFVGDDPLHTGTKLARERFIREHGSAYRVITRADKNLWWFFVR